MTKGNSLEAKRTLKTEWILGITAGVVTLAALGLGRAFGKISHSSVEEKVVVWVAAAVLVIAGIYSISHLTRALGRSVARRGNIGAGASVRLIATGAGYLILIFAFLTVLGVSLDHLLIGAGVAGIILGVAAQQSLGNVFAAIVMLIARPFVVGDMIRIRSGVTGVLDVQVLGIGLTYVTVMTDDGILRVPNSLLLAAGIGQLRPGATPIPSPKPTPPPNAPQPAPAPSASSTSTSAPPTTPASPASGPTTPPVMPTATPSPTPASSSQDAGDEVDSTSKRD